LCCYLTQYRPLLQELLLWYLLQELQSCYPLQELLLCCLLFVDCCCRSSQRLLLS
jgi:hypothetical protein